MIRGSKHTLKFTNVGKLNQLELLYEDYKEQLQYYIDLIWDKKLVLQNNLSSKDLPDYKFNHSQWKQVVYKQASEIIRSNIKKKKKSKPDIKRVGINIDARLIDFQKRKSENDEFDEFIRIKTPYFQETKKRAITINIPIKNHKHSNKYIDWDRKNTIKLNMKNDTFFIWYSYEKDEPEIKPTGRNLGIDCGFKTLLATSDGELIGKNMEHIYTKLTQKKRGSKNYKQLLKHKENQINKIINDLDLNDINFIVMENLKNVKYKSKFSKQFNNKLQYWAYAQVLNKFERICQEKGIRMMKVSPSYTSQICSCCGTLDKDYRKGELYHCSVCGVELNADINASRNILHRGVYSLSDSKPSAFIDFQCYLEL